MVVALWVISLVALLNLFLIAKKYFSCLYNLGKG